MNISELFFAAARQYPEHGALIQGDRNLSYAQLADEVKQTAAYFQNKGLQPGDRVLVFEPMGIDLYRIVLALFQAGLVAVFVDQWVDRKRLKACCELAECRGFIGSTKARFLKWLIPSLRKIPISLKSNKWSTAKADVYPVQPDDSALITFTTGSTGKPKAADRTHDFLHEQFKSLIQVIQPAPTDLDYTNLPILPLLNLATGGTTLLETPKGSEHKIRRQLRRIAQKHSISRITASPALVTLLAEEALLSKLSLAALKKVFTGGAPVYPADALQYGQAFPEAAIKAVYGSTEAEPISTVAAEELKKKEVVFERGLFVGTLALKTQVRILSLTSEMPHEMSEDDLADESLPEGEIGEIVVAGPHVLKKYFRNEEAFRTNKIMTESETWHRTGDSGFLKGNELFLTGRCKDLIHRDEQVISPFVVEGQLKQLENVTAGTILLKDHELVLVIEGQASEKELQSLRELINYDRVVHLKAIPKDPRHRSKIDYERLRGMV